MSLFSKTRRLPQILATFHQTVKDLSALESSNTNTVAENDKKVAEIQIESANLNTEREQAAAVRANIEKLLETPKATKA